MKKVIFLDRDGTLIWEPPDGKVDSMDKIRFMPGVFEALRVLQDNGFSFVMVTNQPALGTEYFPQEACDIPHTHVMKALKDAGVMIENVYICPHTTEDGCACKKPKTGLINEYMQNTVIDYENSFVIGDRLTDMEFAKNIGCSGVLYGGKKYDDAFLESGEWIEIAEKVITYSQNISQPAAALSVSVRQ